MKIQIIEDDLTLRLELKSLLTNAGYSVTILENFKNAKEEIIKEKADLILLDINISYINGEILLNEIRKEINTPVIMLTSSANITDEILSMSYGADDYITKPYNPTLLLLRINRIFRRLENKGDTVYYENILINIRKATITKDNKEIILTKNEMIIFSYLLNNKNKIVSRDELMTELWNTGEYINDGALTVNISRLRTKLKELGIENKLETRKGQGYILL